MRDFVVLNFKKFSSFHVLCCPLWWNLANITKQNIFIEDVTVEGKVVTGRNDSVNKEICNWVTELTLTRFC